MYQEVVVLGDSVTQGVGFSGVTESTCFVSLLRNELTESGLNVRLTASALDGADTGYALRRFERMVTRLQPDLLVVALGLNDARPPGRRAACDPGVYARNLSKLTELALEIDVRPVLSTPSPRLDVEPNGQHSCRTMQPYAESARRVAEYYQLPIIDVFERLTAQGNLDSLIPDRLHPGPDGHRLIADHFAQTLLPLLGVKRSNAKFDGHRELATHLN